MRSPPAELAPAELRASLARAWGIEASSLQYVPEGGGSHHWKALDISGRNLFVTVDDLDNKDWLAHDRDDVFEGLARALNTSAVLRRRAGLRFVVAPIATTDNRLVVRLDERYAASVFPYLVGHAYPFGPHTDPELRAETLRMVIAVHNATPMIGDQAPSHRLTFGGRRDLTAFLADPDKPWDGGPFSASTQACFRPLAATLRTIVAGFDRLVESTIAAREKRVITHGEPHAANTLSVHGRLVLIDWDTVALAAPERDLWMIAGDDQRDQTAYEAATGHSVDPTLITLYRLRWYLDDIGSAARLFRNPHVENDDTRRWADGLSPRLEELASWEETLLRVFEN